MDNKVGRYDVKNVMEIPIVIAEVLLRDLEKIGLEGEESRERYSTDRGFRLNLSEGMYGILCEYADKMYGDDEDVRDAFLDGVVKMYEVAWRRIAGMNLEDQWQIDTLKSAEGKWSRRNLRQD